jgi:hypothetical protein
VVRRFTGPIGGQRKQAFLEAHEHAFHYFGGVLDSACSSYTGDLSGSYFICSPSKPLFFDQFLKLARNFFASRLIEAKGETSARQGSARSGKPFDSAQARVHVAEAFYTVARLYAEHHSSGDSVGIAFPETSLHRRQLNAIKPVIDLLGILVYFVQRDRSVSPA